MQYLRYRPTEVYTSPASAGTFEFPVAAVIKYLQYNIDCHGFQEDAEFLQEVVTMSKAEPQREILPLQTESSMDLRAAHLIDRGAFVVYCPCCETYFTPSQIRVESWIYYQDPNHFGGGRVFMCSIGHELLRVQDWMA